MNAYTYNIAPKKSWAGTAGPKAANGCRMCFRLLVHNELNSRYSFAYTEGYTVYLTNAYTYNIAPKKSWAGTAGPKAANGCRKRFSFRRWNPITSSSLFGTS